MSKTEPGGERRTKARRRRTDRRQMIRWETKKEDRRTEVGQRKEDKALDCIRSVYELSPPTRRSPLVREVDLTSKPLRVERRAGARRVTDVKVFAYDGVDIRKCRLLDIGLDGAYIETETFTLLKGTQVELVLKIRPGGKPRHCRLPAKVVRVEIGGAALKFDHLDKQVYTILRGVVRPSKTKPHLRVISRS
ncbi:MAG: PilZ domain-containing protein [Gammaproteobacteria bacterium]|nr:PilZ domain-containing protein [Gammaproteobacteria bacterium]